MNQQRENTKCKGANIKEATTDTVIKQCWRQLSSLSPFEIPSKWESSPLLKGDDNDTSVSSIQMDRRQAVFPLASWHWQQPRKLDSRYVALSYLWNMESILTPLNVGANNQCRVSTPATKLQLTRVDLRIESNYTSPWIWLKTLTTCLTALPSKNVLKSSSFSSHTSYY